MNIEKYQMAAENSNYHQPQQLRDDFRRLLNTMAPMASKTHASLHVYNLLCGLEALLNRYETVSRETLFAMELIVEERELREHLYKLHAEVMNHQV